MDILKMDAWSYCTDMNVTTLRTTKHADAPSGSTEAIGCRPAVGWTVSPGGVGG